MKDTTLLKQAMLGTDKSVVASGADLSSQTASNAIAALTESIANDDPAWNLLLKAGCWAVAEKAGFLPQTVAVDFNITESSPAAEEETQTPISLPLVEVLNAIVKEYLDFPYVSLFFLKRLAEAQLRLPFESLPRFLTLFSQRTFYRDHWNEFASVLGERGRWICSKNPEWKNFDFGRSGSKFAAEINSQNSQAPISDSEFEEIWNEGTFRERESALLQFRQGNHCENHSENQEERQNAANQAREMLAQTWKSEKAEHRETFLQTLVHGISEADVPFLEDALKDRSKGVRQIAVKLLPLISESDFAKRAVARAEEIFVEPSPGPYANTKSVKVKGFIEAITDRFRGKKQLQIVPPKTYTKEMKADAIDEKPPQGAGQQAWWLFQVLSRIPPSHWTVRWNLTPQEFLTALENDDFFIPALQALTQAALQFEQQDWFDPLWNAWSSQKKNFKLPPFGSPEATLAERCLMMNPLKYWRLIQNGGTNMFFKDYDLTLIWKQLVVNQPIPWSDDFTTVLLEFLKSSNSAMYSLAHTAALFPEELHEQVRRFVHVKKSSSYFYGEKQIERGLELRTEFERLLKEM